MSWLAGSRRIRLICWPIEVPPGSWFSTTVWPAARNRSTRSRAWVVFPLPSLPSKVMNRPLVICSVCVGQATRSPAPHKASVIHIMEHSLEIQPGIALGLGADLAEQIGGVVGDHHRNAVPAMPLAAKPGDSLLHAEQSLHCRSTQNADGLRLNRVELARQELAAGFHLVG